MKCLSEVLTNAFALKQHIKKKRNTLDVHLNLQTCTLRQIDIRTQLKLYESTILPALIHRCKTCDLMKEN